MKFTSAIVHAGWLAAALACGDVEAQRSSQTAPATAPWWKNAVIYEIYPRSFQDSNGDGIGDLNGITSRLDYLQSLGVDALWLTPIYPSPQVDFGYDISDYTAIDPQYGTLADFDRLVGEAKKRGMRVLMDLVLNHTSDQHPWFVESARSRDSPKRDWYIWRDGTAGAGVHDKPGPPNNWVNRIEQSAWRFDPRTGQYVYHYYAPEQPDLNWRNPAVEQAMFEAARFWWRRGVSGFRLDAINTLFEDAALRDEPHISGTNEYGEASLSQVYQRNLPEVHGVLRDLRRVSDTYPGSVLIGEVYTQSTPELAAWYGAQEDELQLPMNTNVGFINKLDAAVFRARLSEAETILAARNTPLLVFDNHDRPRSWDRYGDGVHNAATAKMLAAILFTAGSTSLLYQGEELGMETITPTRREDVRDPRGLAGWPQEKGRDGERTPMQWDATRNAGFSTAASTWLPVQRSYRSKNVASESVDPASLLRWTAQLIALKRDNTAVHLGSTLFLNHDFQHVLAWVRRQAGMPPVLVLCNMSGVAQTVEFGPELQRLGMHGPWAGLLSSDPAPEPLVNSGRILLAPFATRLLTAARP